MCLSCMCVNLRVNACRNTHLRPEVDAIIRLALPPVCFISAGGGGGGTTLGGGGGGAEGAAAAAGTGDSDGGATAAETLAGSIRAGRCAI